MVQSSIKEAQEKIRKQTEKEESQVGIIRKLPVVGSVFNWWSPIKVMEKGSSFNIMTNELKPQPTILNSGSNTPTKLRSPKSTPKKKHERRESVQEKGDSPISKQDAEIEIPTPEQQTQAPNGSN